MWRQVRETQKIEPNYQCPIVLVGGKNCNPPSLATIFFETRKKGGQLEGDNTNKKYNEILEASQSQPELSNIELIEKCFGTQCRQHVVCYGGGVKPTDLKPSYSSRAELNAKLCETQKENQSLRSRMDGMEAELQKLRKCSSNIIIFLLHLLHLKVINGDKLKD
uniref:Uncharacterized protein n=1 Tax=Ananas comosus var. bracteatus TaxID=296719 RepID=A0A6V7PSJ3_ANACO|nr:unnamed protein product [Ananas comosus var. bracteatus]